MLYKMAPALQLSSFGMHLVNRNASRESMLTSDLMQHLDKAGPLTFEDIDHSPEERSTFRSRLINTVLRIIITHGGKHFEVFKPSLQQFETPTELAIPTHQSVIRPLPAMNIDQSSVVGNSAVPETVYYDELQFGKGSENFSKSAHPISGDQLSIDRLRSLVSARAGHERDSWPMLASIIGLFHAKLTATDMVLETHFGKQGKDDPAGLESHNVHLHRRAITLSATANFRSARDLILTRYPLESSSFYSRFRVARHSRNAQKLSLSRAWYLMHPR
jgi:hypothetical protein